MNAASLLNYSRTAIVLLLATLGQLVADQPIMNMMPRWDGGYGLQVLAEEIHRSDLKQGDDVVASGYSEDVSILHLQGVYTWDRSVRLTFKLPYIVDARREVVGPSGEKVIQHDEGLGDLTLALPIKQYFNLAARSGSWTLAPQVRVPLGQADDAYEVADRVWGGGLFAGYETETYNWFFATGVSIWLFEDPEPAEWHFSLDLGWNALDYLQILWESDFHWDDEDTFILSAGPAVYTRFSDNIHARLEWKHDLISEVSSHEPDHGNGNRLSIGIGFVF